jgi:energy-coupling factor transport system ATP-binding protein
VTLRALEIEHLAQAEPRALSAGQRQRVAIAAMTVADPQVLVLDEPTRGLDWESKTHVGAHLRALQDSGKTVVVVTHDVEFAAAYSDRVAVMGAGRILSEGPTEQVLGSSTFLAPQAARVLGHELGAPVVTVEAARALLRGMMSQ